MAAARILFLCTGNHDRSRFAEIVFNTRASAHGVSHLAFSRGLVLLRGDA
jgi:protein-tyrosine-phosphatase